MFQTRSLIATLSAAFVALPLVAAAQSKDFNETVALASGGRLRVEGSKGSITVTAWDQNEVEIHARIEAPKNVSDDYARRAVDATTVDVKESNGSVRIESNYRDVPDRSGFGKGKSVPAIHYEIRAPRKLDLFVDSDRGPTTVAGFEGELELHADRSEVALRELTGRVVIEIDRGDNSTITALKGSFELEADRTDVRMRDVQIDADSRLEIDRGDVEIGLEASQGLTLRTEMSRRAEFDTELPLTMSSLDGRDFKGTINGGGPELFIGSDRASVKITAGR